jgi:hypothetical protein
LGLLPQFFQAGHGQVFPVRHSLFLLARFKKGLGIGGPGVPPVLCRVRPGAPGTAAEARSMALFHHPNSSGFPD